MPDLARSRVPSRVLIVDDDPFMRGLLGDLLESLGVAYEVAGDGHDALLALRRSDGWSAILLDIMMPRVNGFELLARLGERVPELVSSVVVVSALIVFEQRARDYGVTRFVRKPVEIPCLMQHLAELGAIGAPESK